MVRGSEPQCDSDVFTPPFLKALQVCLSTWGINCVSGPSVVMVNFGRIIQPPYEENHFCKLSFYIYELIQNTYIFKNIFKFLLNLNLGWK